MAPLKRHLQMVITRAHETSTLKACDTIIALGLNSDDFEIREDAVSVAETIDIANLDNMSNIKDLLLNASKVESIDYLRSYMEEVAHEIRI